MAPEKRPRESVAGFPDSRVAPALLALLVLAAGCTFERRPGTRTGQDTIAVETPSPGESLPPGESAGAFLERFQEVRKGGATDGLDSMVRPGATVMLDGRALDLQALAPPGEAGDGAEPRLADSVVVDGAALFVIRYGTSLETILLTRDSAGWGVRLLHRVTRGDGDPGRP